MRLIIVTQMPGPVPDLIFAVEDYLAAVTGDACVFHDFFEFCCDRSTAATAVRLVLLGLVTVADAARSALLNSGAGPANGQNY
jgi:hypothetical protein